MKINKKNIVQVFEAPWYKELFKMNKMHLFYDSESSSFPSSFKNGGIRCKINILYVVSSSLAGHSLPMSALYSRPLYVALIGAEPDRGRMWI